MKEAIILKQIAEEVHNSEMPLKNPKIMCNNFCCVLILQKIHWIFQ